VLQDVRRATPESWDKAPTKSGYVTLHREASFEFEVADERERTTNLRYRILRTRLRICRKFLERETLVVAPFFCPPQTRLRANSSTVITSVPAARARSNRSSASDSNPGTGLMQSRSRTTRGVAAGVLLPRNRMNWS
jgi:hypothetical protein